MNILFYKTRQITFLFRIVYVLLLFLVNPERLLIQALEKNYQFFIVLWEMIHRNENKIDTEKRKDSIKEKCMAIFDSTNNSDFFIYLYIPKKNRQIQYNISTTILNHLIIFLHLLKMYFCPYQKSNIYQI